MGDEAEQHEGSRWDLSIRDGLVEGKHRRVMGEAIWLYLYLHKHVGFATGIMPQYRHDVAAAELDLPLRTIKLHMDRLAKAGYVVVTRGWHCCKVEITRYKVPEGRQPLRSQVQSVASDSPSHVQDTAPDNAESPSQVQPVAPDTDPAEGVKCNGLPSQVQQTARGTNTSVFNNKDATANAVVDAGGGHEPSGDAHSEQHDRAERLCGVLEIEPTSENVREMAGVVDRWAGRCEAATDLTLEEKAFDCRQWLSDPTRNKGRRKSTVTFFRNTWLIRDVKKAEAARAVPLPGERSTGNGEHRGRSRADEATHAASTERRDAEHDRRLARHLARGGTAQSFYGL